MKKNNERFHISLTEYGKVALGGTGFVALAALVIPAFGVLSVLICSLLTALLAGYIVRPQIELSGGPPDRVVAGNTTLLKYTIKNVGRWSVYNLRVRIKGLPKTIEQVEDGTITDRLKPGESSEVTILIRPMRRGHYQLKQPVCESGFPFNLFNFGTSASETHSLIALPGFSMLHIETRQMSRHVCTNGATVSNRMGYSNEYAGNRPFMPGDSLRTIDSRAWARLSVPATKEYHSDLDHYTGLVLDASVSKEVLRTCKGEVEEFEGAISLCASVAFSINNKSLIDILLAGSRLYEFAGQARSVRLDRIHDILAGIKPDRGMDLEGIDETLAEHFREISEVIFILLNWNQTNRELVGLAESEGCYCKVFLIDGNNRRYFERNGGSWHRDIHLLSSDDILAERIKQL